MKKQRFNLSFLLLVFFCTFSIAKDFTPFSKNTDEFIKELGDFMKSSNNSSSTEIFNAFEKQFKKGIYTTSEIEYIISTSNKMRELDMSVHPFFNRYLQSLSSVKKNDNTGAKISSWHKTLEHLLTKIEGRKFKNYTLFLDFSYYLIEENYIRYSKSGVNWQVDSPDYEFGTDADGPFVTFLKTNVECIRKDSKLKITATSGTVHPLSNTLKAKGGKTDWAKVGMEKVYVEFADFNIDLTKGIYSAKGTKFFFPDFFQSRAVVGNFEDKLTTAKTKSYPQFESTEYNLTIDNIGAGIKYQGGFMMNGTKVYGKGTKENKANIFIENKAKQQIFKGAAELFVIKKDKGFSGEGIEAVIYIENDSIYHPSSNSKFKLETKTLNLQRGKRGRDRNPFTSSYHNININVDRIDWNIETNMIELGKKVPNFIDANKRITFESLDYFSESEYMRLQNVSSTHPLALLNAMVNREGVRTFDAKLVATRLNSKFDVSSIQSLIYDLVAKGFINYDKDTQMIEVKDKVLLYADASMKKIDFDNIKITSVTDETNAILNLDDHSLIVNGTKSFEFSPLHRVAAKPAGKQLVFRKNRTMEFDGTLFAGFGIFEGKGYTFDYDKFQITMDSVRFMDLFLPTGGKDDKGNPIALSMGSRIEYVSGVLLLDAPNNKAGRNEVEMFPSFNSKGYSYVYYDSKNILEGIYKRDNFHFAVNPFGMNNLDKFSDGDVKFKGKLVSANIFPDIEETAILQEDKSLGFITQTPEEGLPAYSKKGNYKGEINLSNNGLSGKGNISYLWASMDSEDILFKPEQMLSTARQFNLKEDRSGKVEVPQVVGQDISIDWRPYVDSMYIRSKDQAFNLFKESGYTIKDVLILTPDGLKGKGVFDSDKGRMSSDLFSFGAFSVESDTANLQIKASGVDHLALDTENVYVKLDFDAQLGNVKANIDSIVTTLPYNEFQTSLNEYDWDMRNETITFKSQNNEFGNFLSIHPDQESLSFDGKTALYDLKTNQLKIDGVPNIVSADALIYPEDEHVDIQPGGVITTLENARIVANTVNKNHVFNRATVKVKGKKLYTASGFYEYNVGPKKQEIEFSNIRGGRVGKGKSTEKEVITKGQGEVYKDQNFFIDQKTKFIGEIFLSADDKKLKFEGFAELQSPLLPQQQWFSVNCKGDKEKLVIEYDTPKNMEGVPLFTGIYLSKEDFELYPTVMSPKKLRKDRSIIEAKGALKFNTIQDEFIFGDSMKVVSGIRDGNLLTFSNKNGQILTEGQFDICNKLKYINLSTFGQAKITPAKDDQSSTIEFDLVAGIDMDIPDALMNIMLQDFNTNLFDAPNVMYKNTDLYDNILGEMIPDYKKLAMSVAELKSANDFVIPAEYNKYSFLFGELPMKWESEYQSFVSTKTKIGLASINGVMFNKIVDAYLEFKMPTTEDDRLYLYLVSPSGHYYFFGFKKGILNTVSNNPAFTDALLNLKKKDLSKKMDDGEFYEIQPVNAGTASLFLERIKTAQGN